MVYSAYHFPWWGSGFNQPGFNGRFFFSSASYAINIRKNFGWSNWKGAAVVGRCWGWASVVPFFFPLWQPLSFSLSLSILNLFHSPLSWFNITWLASVAQCISVECSFGVHCCQDHSMRIFPKMVEQAYFVLIFVKAIRQIVTYK